MNLQVFYHIAAMGDWREVVAEQLRVLKESGLDSRPVFVTFTGDPSALRQILTMASTARVPLGILRRERDLSCYETPAMVEIERWARRTRGCAALYLHTKGVSRPGHQGKRRWRQLMQDELVRKWREHLPKLHEYDAIGLNWRGHPHPPHFCGNFWIAKSFYLRTLEDFDSYNSRRGFERTNCEFWIGTGSRTPRLLSLVHRDVDYCSDEYFGREEPDFP